MDCIQAQALISEALDHQPVDAALLEEAKSHCRTCESCTLFVRALNVIQRAPLPAPPADLTDRIMAVVRAEAAATEQAGDTLSEEVATAEALAGALTEGSAAPTDSATATIQAATEAARNKIAEKSAKRITVTPAPAARSQNWAWAAGVAAVLILAVVGGSLGLLNSLNSKTATESTGDVVYNIAPESVTSAAPESALSATGAQGGEFGAAAKSTTSTVLFVTYGGAVYRQAGGTRTSRGDLASSGSVSTSFDAQTPFAMHDVFTSSAEPDVIYIANGTNNYERFELVTRSYQGKTYVLNSNAIDTFGGWPGLPSGIPAPAAPDGSPVFLTDGTDATGVTVYRRTGADARLGIAIAPNTATSDPAAGNPNWTWWVEKQ